MVITSSQRRKQYKAANGKSAHLHAHQHTNAGIQPQWQICPGKRGHHAWYQYYL